MGRQFPGEPINHRLRSLGAALVAPHAVGHDVEIAVRSGSPADAVLILRGERCPDGTRRRPRHLTGCDWTQKSHLISVK